MKRLRKIFKWFIIFFFALIVVVLIMSRGRIYSPDERSYGVTFSKKQAVNLGLDWRGAYLAALDDLKAKKIRLSAYWDEAEPVEGAYNWDDLDWQIDEANARGAQVILAVGGRLPRWPECHWPGWAKTLAPVDRQEKLLDYIAQTITRYKEETAITAWQVENEPFLPYFGECPPPDIKFLDAAIALVRQMDDRPVVVTDSGELSIWIGAARRADIFGTSMYRDTYSAHLKRYVHYPISPGFFRFKKNLTRLFAKPKEWVVIELQAEPWAPEPFQNISREERERTMSPEKFKDMIEFSGQTGFKDFYLWGVEYWYWEKTVNHDDRMWEEAKKLF
jgi:hypothetical protein